MNDPKISGESIVLFAILVLLAVEIIRFLWIPIGIILILIFFHHQLREGDEKEEQP